MAVNALAFRSYNITRAISLGRVGFNDWRSRGCIRIAATVTENNSKVSEPIAAMVRRTPERELDDRCGNLDMILGGPVMLTYNIEVAAGIANGTLATVVDIILKPDATIRVVPIRKHKDLPPGGPYVHAVEATDVVGLVLRHRNPDWVDTRHYPSLPPGCFPVSLPANFKRQYQVGANVHRLAVDQFQVVPCFALTGHKTQGQTLSSVFVARWDGRHKLGKSGWLYVALSRVRRLRDFYMISALETNPDRYHERSVVMYEMARVRRDLVRPTYTRMKAFISNPDATATENQSAATARETVSRTELHRSELAVAGNALVASAACTLPTVQPVPAIDANGGSGMTRTAFCEVQYCRWWFRTAAWLECRYCDFVLVPSARAYL